MHFYKIYRALFLVILSTSAQAKDPASQTLLASMEGNVWVDSEPAKAGMTLSEKSIIKTEQGKATLLFGKETVVHVGEDSILHVSDYLVQAPTHSDERSSEKLSLDLKYGKVRALLRNKGRTEKVFQIRSRSATMGVRGTHIALFVPPDPDDKSRYITIEGQANIAPEKVEDGGKSIILNANQSYSEGDLGTEEISSSDAQDIAHSIAVAPEPILTEHDFTSVEQGELLKNFDKLIGAQTDEQKLEERMENLEILHQGITFDPISDRPQEVPVTIIFSTQ